jgi:hypothetical protein
MLPPLSLSTVQQVTRSAKSGLEVLSMGRSIIIILLILVILVSMNPQVRAKVGRTWENIKPAVVAAMDNLYAEIRSFVTGSDSENRTNESPVTPGVNFDVIVTMTSALPL